MTSANTIHPQAHKDAADAEAKSAQVFGGTVHSIAAKVSDQAYVLEELCLRLNRSPDKKQLAVLQAAHADMGKAIKNVMTLNKS